MNHTLAFLIFLAAFLQVLAVWSIAIDVSRIADWLRKGNQP
jgi:hypothetical protein